MVLLVLPGRTGPGEMLEISLQGRCLAGVVTPKHGNYPWLAGSLPLLRIQAQSVGHENWERARLANRITPFRRLFPDPFS